MDAQSCFDECMYVCVCFDRIAIASSHYARYTYVVKFEFALRARVSAIRIAFVGAFCLPYPRIMTFAVFISARGV